MLDLIFSAGKNVLKRRRQIALTVIGIGIGVFSVLLIATIGATGREMIGGELEALGFDCITISANDRAHNLLREESVDFLRMQTEVSAASPVMMDSCQVTMRGYIGDAMLCGIDADADSVLTFELAAGRFLTREDMRRGAQVCLVNEKLADAFYGRSNIIGKTVEVVLGGRAQSYTIVGIVAAGESTLGSLAGGYLPYMAYIPYTAFGTLTGRTELDMVFLRFSDTVGETEAAAQEITEALSASDGYRNLYKYQNLAAKKESIGAIINIITAVLTAIGAVSLLVSGLSIMTIMMASVSERTREIGVKKALGAGKRIILLEFLTESAIITAAGSIFGVALSFLLSAAAGVLLDVRVVQETGTMLWMLLFSVGSGIAFGVYPALKAAQLSPLEALRRE